MGDEFETEFHDVEFEEYVKKNVPSYKVKELIKMSRAVDRLGNKMRESGYRVMIGVVDESDDLFKFYSSLNPAHYGTLEMLARLVKKTCEEVQDVRNLEEKPTKEILKELASEVEAMG